ncbi:hypothetical protein SAMN05444372_11462 [Flavobacterium micromati]|uniref:Uncharacterized protein n=2 Tax=Flavobacterium micromati TaxID=229205 RepID=A0A1M5Q4N1_9FLAO|nr:hypothetical protein SAMN05444372_11462 [Flavobacterium micromati]
MMKNIIQQIDEEISKKTLDDNDYKLVTNKEKGIKEFFHFLETGAAAWWNIDKTAFISDDVAAFQEILKHKDFTSQLINALKKPVVRSRFIKQFNDDQILLIINKGLLHKSSNKDNNAIIARIEKTKKSINDTKLTLNQRFLFWEIIILTLLDSNENVAKQKLFHLLNDAITFDKKYNPFLLTKEINIQLEKKSVLEALSTFTDEILNIEKKIEETISNQSWIEGEQEDFVNKFSNSDLSSADRNILEDKYDETDLQNKKANLEQDERKNLLDSKQVNDTVLNDLEYDQIFDHYIDNAGLILIHPFLKHLFDNCHLFDKSNEIRNPEVAAHLLHYVATGREQDYEHTMVFEKFLCNIPINQPIDRNILLPEKYKTEAREMLRSVLINWDKMKNSSVELLQNEFLQRPGKITLKDGESPKIIIERKTQDILLDNLSWNISIVKIAWKKRIIYTDW